MADSVTVRAVNTNHAASAHSSRTALTSKGSQAICRRGSADPREGGRKHVGVITVPATGSGIDCGLVMTSSFARATSSRLWVALYRDCERAGGGRDLEFNAHVTVAVASSERAIAAGHER